MLHPIATGAHVAIPRRVLSPSLIPRPLGPAVSASWPVSRRSMSTDSAESQRDKVSAVRRYHERSKHRVDGFAPGPGGLDWANQPDPFRRFSGCSRFNLPLEHLTETPAFDALVAPYGIEPDPLSAQSVSKLLYNSLALSATKRARLSEWHLRVNPSSGNLHPTEAYLIAPPLGPGFNLTPAVLHYCSDWHVLEQRATLDDASILEDSKAMILVLSSIYWREAWKYGGRAFRYCMHDVGHAVAAIRIAAAAMGWRAYIIHGVGDDDLGALCGLDGPEFNVPEEREHADVAIRICTRPNQEAADTAVSLPEVLIRDAVAAMRWSGRPNRLTPPGGHQVWSEIDIIHAATRTPAGPAVPRGEYSHVETPLVSPRLNGHESFSLIARRRRSAVDMDRTTSVASCAFYRMIAALIPSLTALPWDVAAWPAAVHLAILVHRIEGLIPGLYMVLRSTSAVPELQARLRREFHWETPLHCPAALRPHVFRLHAQDLQLLGKQVSCGQKIAADGCFSLGMLADMRMLTKGGQDYPWLYKSLFWESGMIGQVLYLEAELAGVRGTGIGCFFDDAFHSVLGLEDGAFQSIYHFAVGSPVEDPRLQTVDPYSRAPRPVA